MLVYYIKESNRYYNGRNSYLPVSCSESGHVQML